MLAAAVSLSIPAAAQSAHDPGSLWPSSGSAPLDGRKFSASIVREAEGSDAEAPLKDQLFFLDGKFSSALCKRYDFADAPYWVRMEGDRLHFLSELTSPTNGTMLWTGTIRGDVLEGTMRWTKKRWYWTIDAEHRIRGKLEALPATTVTPPS